MSRLVGGEGTKPTYGCQVTIQSEQEKQMMKMYRREEKRERKRGKGIDDSDFSDAALTFDPREMRIQRYIISSNFSLGLFFLSLFVFVLTLPAPIPALRYPHQQKKASAFFMTTWFERSKHTATAILLFIF